MVNGDRTPPRITTGSYVSWSNGVGRVDMVVTSGQVPGVDSDLRATRDSPVARVVIWKPHRGGHRPTRRKTAARVASLRRIPPLTRVDGEKETQAALVTLLADHDHLAADQGLPDWARPSGRAVEIVYHRGERSWPGQVKTRLSRRDWGLARVRVFLLTAASGAAPGGYMRDLDLLPGDHPAGKALDRPGWDPQMHPRDRLGRFIETGARVDIWGGGSGTVARVLPGGRVRVNRDDGRTVTVDNGYLTVTDTAADGASSGAGDEPETPEPQTSREPAPEAPEEPGIPELTDDEYEQHRRNIETRIAEALAAGQSTDATHTLDTDGQVWHPDRADQHRHIVDELYAAAAGVPTDGRAVIAGGLGGAGKSTVLREHAGIDPGQFLTVNPDDVKELMAERGMIPDVEGLSPMEAASLVHEESSHIAGMLAARAYADRRNVIWDITMSSRRSVDKRVAALRAAGYDDVRAVFVDIPIETSVERAISRHRLGLERHRLDAGAGGRYVPPDVIRANASAAWSSANRAVFEDLKDDFDAWSVYDNSQWGREPELISTSDRPSEPEGGGPRGE